MPISSGSAVDAVNTLTNQGVSDNGPLKPESTLTQQDFLTLFTSQLKLQDPMKPIDNSMMMQQMSSLTQLTATQDLQTTIQNLNKNLSTSQVLSASQLIGRRVQVPSNVSPLVDKVGMNGSVVLGQPAGAVDVKISTQDGKLLKTLHFNNPDAGVLDFNWNGMDDNGNPVQPGYYHIDAYATSNGQTAKAITAGSFQVQSVTHDNNTGGVVVNVDGWGGVDMDSIIKIQ